MRLVINMLRPISVGLALKGQFRCYNVTRRDQLGSTAQSSLRIDDQNV
jgi:hypothetical protein